MCVSRVTVSLKDKENLALISWLFSYYLNKYFIKTAVFNIFLCPMLLTYLLSHKGFFLVFKGLQRGYRALNFISCKSLFFDNLSEFTAFRARSLLSDHSFRDLSELFI